MQSHSAMLLLPRAVCLPSLICIALVGCTTEQNLIVESMPNGDHPLASHTALDSGAMHFGPNAEFEAAVTEFEAATASPARLGSAQAVVPFAPAWFVLAGVGSACADTRFDGKAGYEIDGTHASGSVGVGYQFMPYMAVETGYTDFGRVKFRNANPFDSGRIDTDGVQLCAIGIYPFNSVFGAIARVGACAWNEKEKRSRDSSLPADGGGAVIIDSSTNDDGIDLIWGVGMQAKIAGHVAARIEWDRLEKNEAISNVLLSVIWMF